MNLIQIGLLFSLSVHTYLLTCETGYWSIFIYVYMTGCVKCHVYFYIVTVFLACQITIKNVQVQLTVKGKTTPDS
jgi:hypothetical protein